MLGLPKDFEEKMKRLLADEFDDFLNGYSIERQYGLRLNPVKASAEMLERLDFITGKVPWAEEGYYYDADARPGKSPLHEAGMFYIQEPSAMSVSEMADIKPGETVLDLCAAPGGKSTQIAGKMRGRGLLVSNEINSQRAKILSQNIERMGIANAVVLNEDSYRLGERFPAFFDKIIVDAPCSGEGMFRKDPAARDEWSKEQVLVCADRQKEIIRNAFNMLKPGGIMVYSTCTFSPEENEQVIAWLFEHHDNVEIMECRMYKGFDSGKPEWTGEYSCDNISRTVRLWPHKLGGEGHYVAKLRKICGEGRKYNTGENKRKKIDINMWNEFKKECLKDLKLSGDIISFGNQLYCIPKEMPDLSGLKVLRPGLQLGENKKNRFEPAHALAMALAADEKREYGICSDVTVIDMNIQSAAKYQAGEIIECDENLKGWVLMAVNGISTGWGKATVGKVKNHYPKGLRRLKNMNI